MFSVRPSTPTTLTLALRPASAAMAPYTAPAPPMSHFISSMPEAGLIDRPPLSKHTPLPINAIGGRLGKMEGQLPDLVLAVLVVILAGAVLIEAVAAQQGALREADCKLRRLEGQSFERINRDARLGDA